MAIKKLIAKAKPEPNEVFVVCSPTVGVVEGVPDKGVYINASEGFATLTILGQRHVVLMPHDVQGVVTEQIVSQSATPVAHGEPLLRLGRADRLAAAAASQRGIGMADDADELIAVKAPSDGVFYRRPSPDRPAYVEEGSEITTGTVIGMVEIMKSFNKIAYGAPGLPERCTVERILVQDAAEVAFDQPLMLVRPA